MSKKIEIDFLDHVAIRVKNMEDSIKCYEKVLGLKTYKLEKWGEYPVFLLSGKSGIALFPATMDDSPMDPQSKNVKIDHFAFHVNRENFELAQSKYSSLNLEFTVKDHHYFDSIYTQDPDGHTLELTCIKVDEKDFYK